MHRKKINELKEKLGICCNQCWVKIIIIFFVFVVVSECSVIGLLRVQFQNFACDMHIECRHIASRIKHSSGSEWAKENEKITLRMNTRFTHIQIKPMSAIYTLAICICVETVKRNWIEIDFVLAFIFRCIDSINLWCVCQWTIWKVRSRLCMTLHFSERRDKLSPPSTISEIEKLSNTT